MSRKNNMLRAFLDNKEFCEKFEIDTEFEIDIFKSRKSSNVVLSCLAEIIDKFDNNDSNTLYQQIITRLNNKK